MKKVFILLCFALVGLTAMAQSHAFRNAGDRNNVGRPAISPEPGNSTANTANASAFVPGRAAKAVGGIGNLPVSGKAIPAKALNAPHPKGIIREPKGTPRMFSLKTFVKDGESNAGVLDGYCDTVYFDGGDVYFKDFVIPVRDGSFVKGKITEGDMHNGRISIPVGQEVAAGYLIIRGALDDDGYLTADTTAHAFMFKIINDTIISDSVAATNGVMFVLAVNTSTVECTQYNT